MLCYWGAQVREGFGLVPPDQVKHGNSGIRSMWPTSKIQDMSAGRSFLGFIQDGKVLVLRLRSEDCDRLIELDNDRIRRIVCGGDGAVLLSDSGTVLIMDKSTVCKPLKGLDNRQVIQIACGDHHSMALTNDGQLFVWGENSHGQLGLRKDHPGSLSAQHVESLSGIPVAQISAGGDHSFVLSLSGVVFGWGKNSAGQLGLGDTTDRHVPTVVNSLHWKKTVSISCGEEHTATLSKGGTVFTFGSGGSGQLGHKSFQDEHYPRVVAELWGSEVSEVTCGRRHTLVSVASSKLIYSFGCGVQGQLGNREMPTQSVPFPVDLPTEYNHEYTIEKLIAGENHSIALFFKELECKAKSNPCKGVLVLNDIMIDRWLAGTDSWPTIKQEINTVFSSAASLNGSFLKTSCDGHYQTSEEHCGLDFDLVKTSFAKISENKSLITEVVKVVQLTLLPSLNANPTGVESLRVYLLLPELIRHLKKQKIELTEALASKILQLNPDARKVLEKYWSKLPDDWLKSLMKLFHKESAELIGQISSDEMGYDLTRRLRKFLKILQIIYQVCCSANRDITKRDLIIHEINDLLVTLEITLSQLGLLFLWSAFPDSWEDMVKLKDYCFETVNILVKFPFVADSVSKQRMLSYLQGQLLYSFPERDKMALHGNILHINRDSALTDTLTYLRQQTHSFCNLFKVVFIGENGIDMRGLSAEFFSLIFESLLKWDKKVLVVHERSLVWFNPDNTQDTRDFYYLGVICGMALFNHHYISIDFPLALYKKLLKLSPTLNDLEELSPVEARNLKNLLEEDEDEVVDLFSSDFTVKGKKLIPNGDQIPVTKANRQKYVDLYVDFVFNKSVKKQFKHFSEGFSTGCPLNGWSMFHPEELQELLQGSPKYDWNELQQCASYESCSASDELIKNFWTVFFELSEENKKKFLMFLYGTYRVPLGGFSDRPLKIRQVDCPDAEDRSPESQTCFDRLIIPKYRDINTLRDKLINAITNCKVFGRAFETLAVQEEDRRTLLESSHALAVNMLCYWGAQIKEGFGLVKPDQVKKGNSGIRSMCPKLKVQDLSSGRSFIGFIRDGKVSVLSSDGKLKQPQLKNDRIRRIVCGGASAVLLSDSGTVLIMDKSTVCKPLKGLDNRQVIQITCGDHHSMALTNDGQLLVWGENSHGQLGLRKDHPTSPSAQHVESLSGIPVAQISAGGDHSFVLSLSGVVFGWGKNSAGQLGLGDTTDRHVPTVVNSLNRKKTVSISCGGEHTATLSKGGTVFTFGSGGSGQLGHNSFEDEHYPRVVAELWGSEVSQVTCGRHHTLVSVASSKLIYSFGCEIQGQLGNGEIIKQSVPFPVNLPTEYNHEYTMDKLIAGENHSFALFFKELESKAKSNPSKEGLTLNDRMIDRWLAGTDSWATINKEINTVFSSAVSLNRRFLKMSCDEHYQTSEDHCGLDFDLVKASFAKLSESKNLILEVVKVVQQMLRSLNPNPSGVESLRVYLLLPELIRHLKKQQRTELTEELASKILQLNPDARKVLEKYWSKLPDDWLKSLVKLFRRASAKLIGQISQGEMGHDLTKRLKRFLKILQMIYQVPFLNSRSKMYFNLSLYNRFLYFVVKVCFTANRDISKRDFIIHEINDLLDTLKATLEDLILRFLQSALMDDCQDIQKLKDYYFEMIAILVKFPFAADTASKQRMFFYLRCRLFAFRNMFLNGNMLQINRESVWMDTFAYLRQKKHKFCNPLQVKFIGEIGVDMRGLSAEFFSLLSQSLLKWEKKVLEVHESSLVWFNPDGTQDNRDFYYLGVICGMALYNGHYMNLDFPLALYKKLLKLSPTLNDLEELSPVEARSLKSLLEEDEDEVVDMFCLDFMIKGKKLIPNGDQIQVTKANRQKYVDLYIDFVFNKSVKKQFKHFLRGFSKGCPLDAWSMFHPEELQELLHGSPKYEWSELQQCASYEKCSASDELIKNFWVVFFELSEENKRKFLMFLYGTDRVPVGGFSKRSLRIFQSDHPDAEDRLPEAQTCFGRLILPKYSDINTLHDKLIHAISFCEVFGRG
ncbi:uncharacterized protein [Garra rufa]|uniref:uncharacterized protein n=1 Tax=Garra rufa TaxID=137080 RepID=UPI003CCE56A0